jgi:exonuclease VII large subunit
MFRSNWFPAVEEIQGEHQQLETRSYQALRNMLGYCQARVIQLAAQHQHLDFQAQQQQDLYQLLETSRRLERVQSNFLRFSEKCLLIKLEIARRGDVHRADYRGGECYEA